MAVPGRVIGQHEAVHMAGYWSWWHSSLWGLVGRESRGPDRLLPVLAAVSVDPVGALRLPTKGSHL